MTIKVLVITVSDRASDGTYADESGPAVAKWVTSWGFSAGVGTTVEQQLVGDEQQAITNLLLGAVEARFNLVVTTGGTGIGPRDVTPEATKAVVEKEVPGFGEQMRSDAIANGTHLAMLSRAVCGVAAETLIVNVPGSPKAAVECLEAISPALQHALKMIAGNTDHAN